MVDNNQNENFNCADLIRQTLSNIINYFRGNNSPDTFTNVEEIVITHQNIPVINNRSNTTLTTISEGEITPQVLNTQEISLNNESTSINHLPQVEQAFVGNNSCILQTMDVISQ